MFVNEEERIERLSEKEQEIMRFWTFCVERFKVRHGIAGLAAGILFSKNGIFKFLACNFEVEHILDAEQIVDDIDRILKRKGALI